MALKEETAPQKAETQVCGQSGGRSEVGLATSAPRSAVVGAVSKRSESDVAGASASSNAAKIFSGSSKSGTATAGGTFLITATAKL
jgi:hypothetical protein